MGLRLPAVFRAYLSDPLVADEVAARLRQRPVLGAMLERLGPVVWQRSVAAAGVVLEELEATARLWLMVEQPLLPLLTGVVRELHRRFGDPAQEIVAA